VRFPSQVAIYQAFVRSAHHPPTQMEFGDRVLTELRRDQPSVSVEGAMARCYRTYPRLVRQHHMTLMLADCRRFGDVLWLAALDERGLDLLVLDEGRAVGVALSTDTERGRFWRGVKGHRAPPLRGLPIVSLNASPSCRVGPFWVHPQSDVQRVIDTMVQLKTSSLLLGTGTQ
jgi:hypothetical protein